MGEALQGVNLGMQDSVMVILVVGVVVMFFRGDIVTRKVHEDRMRDKDKVIDLQEAMINRLLEGVKVTNSLLGTMDNQLSSNTQESETG